MHNLAIAVFCSVIVSVFLKVAHRHNIQIAQAIAFNYIMAIGLSYYFLKPNFAGQSLGEVVAQHDDSYLFLALGILLPTVFIVMSRAVESAGIVRSDAAQRLSLFLPILASFTIFNEVLSGSRAVSLVLAFTALLCLLWKKDEPQQNLGQSAVGKGWFNLLLVWLGYGVIDILFKQMAKSGSAFPLTLFVSFCLAACVIFIYLLIKQTRWRGKSMLAGLLLGVLNFMNILFYIKAHQSYSSNPTLVFAGMNIGVICLGTLTGALLFKEKINKANAIGVGLGIVSIICLFYLDKLVG
ncbi:EamA/RhaT family transporter [Pasteurellaceae bacterium USgator11]|nr:EamA/RhaT family transporter [Pasteurellaceae bacterium UScroc12]TNG96162.1 EamA/RhaT family transporter [Pasteurellaceae bacterium USgator41]TNG97978.1 EamA/RhaT family transporter [Pasteurellaceae bacterium UScroc31]TNH00163.1 EamA/RhaT family transporter [Pasteurellaceae bacterium USgator11]